MRKTLYALFVVFLLTPFLTAQPQHYNYTTGSGNTFPLGQTAGKFVNWLFPAGAFNMPTPCPPGQQITKVYIRMYGTGSRTYTSLHILMAQTTLTNLTTGQFYAGPWDTVYAKDTSLTSGGANTWLPIQLHTPYPYDPTKSLVMAIGQCGGAGSGMYILQTTVGGVKRTWSVGGCPFTPYSSGDAYNVDMGIDVEPIPQQICTMYSSQWCAANTFPNVPAAVYFNASAWAGDTMYVQCPSTSGAGATTIRRWTYGGSWSTGVPLPAPRTGGTLTECGGKLYYIGGGASSITSGTNTCYEYNPSTGAWTTKANMPAALAAHGAECWGDSVIFVWGGPYSSSNNNLVVRYYRPASNTWGTISNSIPSGQGRRTFAHGISGNKLFMAAGYNSAYLKSFYIGTIGSNASQITWTAGPNVPTSVTGISRPGGAAYDKYFYVVSGELAGGGYGTGAYVWQVGANSWHTSQISPIPHGRSNIFSAVTTHCVNDTVRLFIPGGYSSGAINFFDAIACGPLFVGNVGISSKLPAVYSLSQNYPNPFNPTTKISYGLPIASNVKLVVYDILGREVATLVNEYKTAGNHSVDFNASNLASGVYIYRIDAGKFTATKKMLLVK